MGEFFANVWSIIVDWFNGKNDVQNKVITQYSYNTRNKAEVETKIIKPEPLYTIHTIDKNKVYTTTTISRVSLNDSGRATTRDVDNIRWNTKEQIRHEQWARNRLDNIV